MKNDNIKRVSYPEEINRLVSRYEKVRETCDEHNLLYLISACDLIDAWTESIEKRRKNGTSLNELDSEIVSNERYYNLIHLRVAQAYFDFGYYKNSIKICANINKLAKDDYEYWLEFADDDSEEFCFYAKIYAQTLMQWSNALLKFDDDLNCFEGAAERIEAAIQVYLQLAKYDAPEMKKEYERRVKELNEIIAKYKSRKAEENDG